MFMFCPNFYLGQIKWHSTSRAAIQIFFYFSTLQITNWKKIGYLYYYISCSLVSLGVDLNYSGQTIKKNIK